jgi:non-haem Fe2+, alpha-ketoglutarate-dependent halogenase
MSWTDPLGENRDLSFQDCATTDPKRLSREQIEAYNRDGYLRPFDAFGAEEVERNRAYFDSLLDQINALRDGRDSYALNCYQARCRGIYDLTMNPLILDHVEDIIGPNIICWATHYFCKMPFDERAVAWHQDASYWHLSPARTVTVWLAIDDADAENSAMRFIPGTHRLGPLKWRRPTGPAVLDQEIVDADQLGEPVYDELKAGQFSLHADMLAHGSEPNASARRRGGLTMRYCPPEVRMTHSDWSAAAIICRGEDPAGYWTSCPRPASDDISRRDKPQSIGGN